MSHERCQDGACVRLGELVCQYVEPARPTWGIVEPWVFRYYACKYHRAWWNRKRFKGQKKMEVLKYVTDYELLVKKEAEVGK